MWSNEERTLREYDDAMDAVADRLVEQATDPVSPPPRLPSHMYARPDDPWFNCWILWTCDPMPNEQEQP